MAKADRRLSANFLFTSWNTLAVDDGSLASTRLSARIRISIQLRLVSDAITR